MSVFPNLFYRFNTIPIKIQASYFVYINLLILKLTWRGQRPRIANIIKEKNEVRDLHCSTLRLTVKLMVIKTVWYWERIDRLVEHNLEIDLHKYSRRIFNKGAKTIQWSRESLFKKMMLEKLDIHMQKSESRHRFYILPQN